MKPGYLAGDAQESAQPDMQSEGKDGDPQPHEVESAFNTLMEGEKIKKNSKLMGHVAKHAAAHGAALSAVQGFATPEAKPAKSTKELRAIHEKTALAKRGMTP